jgi:hypothetical protein
LGKRKKEKSARKYADRQDRGECFLILPKHWNELIVVKWFECSAHNFNNFLIGIQNAWTDGVQALPTERSLAVPCVRLGVVDANNYCETVSRSVTESQKTKKEIFVQLELSSPV